MKKRFTNLPLLILICSVVIFNTAFWTIAIIEWVRDGLIPALNAQDRYWIKINIEGIALFSFFIILGFWALYLVGFDILSRYYIEHDELIVKTFLRKRVFLLEELQEVGIYLDKYRQVWIYFSKEELDQAGWKRVNRRGLSKSFMRVPYSQDNYNYFMDNLPYKPLGKQLSRSHTLIDNYHLE